MTYYTAQEAYDLTLAQQEVVVDSELDEVFEGIDAQIQLGEYYYNGPRIHKGTIEKLKELGYNTLVQSNGCCISWWQYKPEKEETGE